MQFHKTVLSFKIIVALLSCFFATDALAQDSDSSVPPKKTFTCKNQELTRRVEIIYDASPKPVPCTVNYHKEDEMPGEMSTLWSAQNTEGFCERKASDFVSKLESWGWSCEA